MLLSDLQIKREKPKVKPYTLNDGMGLSLLIDSAGSKGWRYRYRFAGKPKMISLGVYGDVSLAQTRAKRDEARSMLAKGINPSEARKAGKNALQFAHENSFESVAREWHGSKKATWSEGYSKEVLNCMEKDIFPFIGQRPIEQIEPLELLTVLQKIEKRGALEQTSKIRRRCGEVLRYAVATGRAKYNFAPDLAIAPNKPKTQHFPFPTESELPAFVSNLENYQGSLVTKYATKLLMLTGVRTIELSAAEWIEFDLENALWEIPKERMKKRRPRLVPLSTQALSILKQLQVITGSYSLVFPGHNEVRIPMSEASINKVIKLLGYHSRLTGHGFRHTMSTTLHEHGFESAWIEMQLAHIDKNLIRGIYNHASYIPQRKDMMRWHSNYINSLQNI